MQRPSRSSIRRAVTASILLLLVVAALPAIVAAATVEDLVARAKADWKLTCSVNADLASCTNDNQPLWWLRIVPGTGPIDGVDTQVTPVDLPEDANSVAWMTDMQQFACGDPKAMAAYVQQVGALTKPGQLDQVVIGTCAVTGGLFGGTTTPYVYRVVSRQLPPPTPGPTSTSGPNPTPAATAVHTAHPSPTAAPAASPSPVPTGTPAPTASDLPTFPIAGEQTGPPTPGPSTPVAGPAEPTPAPTPAPTLPTFDQSVLGITDVNTDVGAFGGSLVLALLMLLIIGFAGELFNNTVENNYTEISGWFRKRPLRWLRDLGGRFAGEARVGLLAFIALTALVSSFVDPSFGLDLRSLAEFLGFFVGLVVVLASFKLPAMLAHRRKTGDLGRLRPLPWALVIAIVFVLVSRIGNLQPGYLYAIVLGAIFVKEVTPQEEGRETFYGSLWTLGAAVVSWLGLTWLRGTGADPSGFGMTLLSIAFAAVVVGGLEATAFGLMPLRFMPGYPMYQWNRLGWALLWGLSLFGFVHILISPSSGYVSELSPSAFVAALGVFAGFGAISIGTWLYFRVRPAPDDAAAR
jgi:hypothetical protein